MTTFSALKTQVDTLVDDSTMALLSGDFINQGVSEIAGGMQSALLDVITPPLPDLFTLGAVDTSITDAYVAMPTNFQRDLQLVVAPAGNEIDIANSLIDFTETYPLLDKSGKISEAVEHGGNLYYQGIPTTSEELTIHYYRKPVDMVADAATPDGIPDHLHIALLVNFACWKSYEFLENGIEGEMPNTDKYRNYFFEALKTLELSLPTYIRVLMMR